MAWSAFTAGPWLTAVVAMGAIHCNAPTLSQSPPPIEADTESIVLLWQYGGERFGVAYDPRVGGPRGFALPNFRGEAATVVAVGYSQSVDSIDFSQLTVDLDEEQACLPQGPVHIWTSAVSAEAAEPWAEDAWDVDRVRDAFGLSECAAVNTCLDFPAVRTVELPGREVYETLETYRDGFLATDRSGRFIYIDANEEVTPIPEFAGLPSWAAAVANNGARWFAGEEGRVVTGREDTFEELPIGTTETVTGLSLSPNNERVLAIAVADDNPSSLSIKLHLLKNGRWREIAAFTDTRLDTLRFTAAWDTEETAYFTYGGTQLCRLTDERVVCNRDFKDPGPLMIDDQLGVVFAAVDNRLLYRDGFTWAPAGGLAFVRKPTSLMAIAGGILVGNDIGKIQQIRYDGSECPLLTTIERDVDILRKNNGKIAFIGAYNNEEPPVLVVMDIPGSP